MKGYIIVDAHERKILQRIEKVAGLKVPLLWDPEAGGRPVIFESLTDALCYVDGLSPQYKEHLRVGELAEMMKGLK